MIRQGERRGRTFAYESALNLPGHLHPIMHQEFVVVGQLGWVGLVRVADEWQMSMRERCTEETVMKRVHN